MSPTKTNTLDLELDIINILKSKNFTEAEAVEIVKKLEKLQEEKIKVSETSYKSAFQKDFTRIELIIKTLEQTLNGKIDQSKIDLLKWLFSFFVVLLAVMIIGIFFNK